MELAEFGDSQAVRVGGLIKSVKALKSKKGDAMAFVSLETVSGVVEVVVFPNTYASCSHLLETEEPVVILGNTQKEERGIKIIAERIDLLDEARERYTAGAHVMLRADKISREVLEGLRKLLRQHPGSCPVSLTLHFDKRGEVDITAPEDFTVVPSQELREKTKRTAGLQRLDLSQEQGPDRSKADAQWRHESLKVDQQNSRKSNRRMGLKRPGHAGKKEGEAMTRLTACRRHNLDGVSQKSDLRYAAVRPPRPLILSAAGSRSLPAQISTSHSRT